ncbi:MAG: dehydrogenase [Gammaproteobacteria bacterium]|jgi:TorA maturation chaperone TorD|nr:dehydrogenase [Gammaproteobacteria bacterium]
MVTAASAHSSTDLSTLPALCQIVREDLLLLALLQDRELEAETLHNLRREVDELLGLRLTTPPAREALALLRQGLDDIPQTPDAQTLDILAAEFADIYLNHHLQASPGESVWLDEDGLIMQEPMFQLRGWYQRHGLQVRNWRLRTDDHLVTQLQFIGFLLEGEASPERLEEIGRFLDEHLLRWIGAFGERVGNRCQTRFYAGLTRLTAAYLEEFRDLIALILGVPRPSPEEIAERMRPPRDILGLPVAGPAFPAAVNEGPGW